jgi:uncharacterized membrane protein YgcG
MTLAKRVTIVCCLIIVMAAAPVIKAQSREVALSKPRQHVNDFAEAVDASTAVRLENVLANLNDRTGINFVVVMIKTAGQEDLFSLSNSLAQQWAIGSPASPDKSVLLFVTTDKAKFYTLSSGGATQALPNGLVGAMGRGMRVPFEQGNYGGGLETGLKLFADIMGQYSNFTYEALTTPRTTAPSNPQITNATFKATVSKPPASTRSAKTEDAPALTTSASKTSAVPPVVRADSAASVVAVPANSPAAAETSASPARPRVAGSNRVGGGRAPFVVPAEKAAPIQIPVLKARPAIDGVLNDDAWKNATTLRDFYQVQPGDNLQPSQPTEVLLGRDDKFLYVAFRAHDRSGRVRATVAPRDQISDDDTVGIYLDTFNDKRKAYKLVFNPLGIQADGVMTDGQGTDTTVDVVMQSKGAVTTDGYVVEVAIPFKSLRFDAGKNQLWGVHFERQIRYPNDEVDSWMPISRDQSGYLNQEGHLTGFDGISTGHTLEVIPTLTTSQRARRVTSNNPALPDETRMVNQAPKFAPGVTVKYGIRPNVTASLTVNPDFADVEADRAVITANQRFPIFFAEKRPFFLEGVDIFKTPLQVVHTRTIVDPDVAGKLTGKIGRNSFGLLFASDAAPGNYSEDDRHNPDKLAKIQPFLDKNALVGVLRLKRDIGQQSSIGMIATSYNFAQHHNQTGGFDGRFRLDPQTVLSFQVLGTTARRYFYDPSLDDNVYRTGNGAGYSWAFEKSKRHFFMGFNGEGRTRDYVADVGFTRRTNTNYESSYLSYSSEPKTDARLTSWRVSNASSANFDWQGRSQNWDNYSELALNFRRQTNFSVAYDEGYERLFEEEFGAKRTDLHPGAFFGSDPERSTRKRSVNFSGGTSPTQKYSVYAFFSRTWNAFDYDFGAGPRFSRVSPAALVDQSAPLDPGPGNATDISVDLAYQPTPAWRSSISYTRSKLLRKDTGLTAYSDQIYSLHTEYHLSRFMFVRGRLDYDWLSSDVTGQLLFGWTPNPGTAVYVGYDDYLNYNRLNYRTGQFERGLRRNERVLFVKLSYLFRHTF